MSRNCSCLGGLGCGVAHCSPGSGTEGAGDSNMRVNSPGPAPDASTRGVGACIGGGALRCGSNMRLKAPGASVRTGGGRSGGGPGSTPGADSCGCDGI